MSDDVLNRLKTFQYPFQWDLYGLKTTKFGVLETCKERDGENQDPYNRFHYSIVLAFEYGVSEDWKLAKSELDKCLEYVDSGDRILRDYRVGFHYVVDATMAHVAVKLGNHIEALNILDNISEFDKMSKEDQSAVWSIKASVLLEYGMEGCERAMEYAERAVQLEPAEPGWHLLIGRLEYRKRHRNPGLPPPPNQKELKALEVAWAMQPDANTTVFLAGALVDYARATRSEARAAFERASNLYDEALEKNQGKMSYVIIRCATGFSKMPEKYGGTAKAKKLFLEALKSAPNNPMLNHHLGLIYLREGNYDDSIKYLSISGKGGCLPAALTLLEILVRKEGYDMEQVEARYAEMELEFLQAGAKASLHSHATSYHLVMTLDFPCIVRHFSAALRYSPNPHLYAKYKTRWGDKSQPLNLFTETDLLIRSALREGITQGVPETELQSLLQLIAEKMPNQNWRTNSYQQHRNMGGGGTEYRTVRIEGNKGWRNGRGGGGWRPKRVSESSLGSTPPKEEEGSWRKEPFQGARKNSQGNNYNNNNNWFTKKKSGVAPTGDGTWRQHPNPPVDDRKPQAPYTVQRENPAHPTEEMGACSLDEIRNDLKKLNIDPLEKEGNTRNQVRSVDNSHFHDSGKHSFSNQAKAEYHTQSESSNSLHHHNMKENHPIVEKLSKKSEERRDNTEDKNISQASENRVLTDIVSTDSHLDKPYA